MNSETTYTWDDAKRVTNLRNHGVDFAEVTAFDWDTCLTVEDTRPGLTETRHVSLGLIGERLHVCVYTLREGACRIISLRKANKREIRIYNGE